MAPPSVRNPGSARRDRGCDRARHRHLLCPREQLRQRLRRNRHVSVDPGQFGGPDVVSGGDQGGPLTNGGVHTGEILAGDVDVWSFTATAGERITANIGEITDANDFRPWIRIWAPNGATLGSQSGLAAAAIGDVAAPVSGTYLVLVSSFNSGFDGSGTYRLNLVKTLGAITTSGGDQGGPLNIGGNNTGNIVRGDLDVWTFTATAGQRITMQIAETADTGDFRPWIRVWAPNGGTLGSNSGLTGAQVGPVTAPSPVRISWLSEPSIAASTEQEVTT